MVEAAFRCCNGNCEAIQMIYQSNEQELIEPTIADPNTGCGAEKPQQDLRSPHKVLWKIRNL